MAASKGNKVRSALYIVSAFIIGVVVALLLVRYFDVDLFIDRGSATGDVAVIDEIPSPPVILTPDIPAVTAKYRLAVVIDDMGRSIGRLDDIIALDVPITIAVLPHLSRSTEVTAKATEQGLQVLLHMPMEPVNVEVNDPGRGAIFTEMSDEEVRSIVLDALETLPGIIGLNNHMGSKFTADEEKMKVVLDVLKSKDLFFLDSKTIAKSVGLESARELNVKAAARDVFLDNEQDQVYIEGQLRKALALAKRKGTAIAIGHPYPETIDAIKAVMAEGDFEGVTIVGVSELIE